MPPFQLTTVTVVELQILWLKQNFCVYPNKKVHFQQELIIDVTRFSSLDLKLRQYGFNNVKDSSRSGGSSVPERVGPPLPSAGDCWVRAQGYFLLR